MRVCDVVAKFILDIGVKDVFMLSGTGAIFLDDAILNSEIRIVSFRNEATGPMMAAAYARVTNNIGVVCLTTGPGGVNAIPGVVEAWVDSTPLLIISGQVESIQFKKGYRSFGIQGFDIVRLVEPITKFAKTINEFDDVLDILIKAKNLAMTGRPGPVWIDIPFDIQNKEI